MKINFNLFANKNPKRTEKSPGFVSAWDKENKRNVTVKIGESECQAAAWIRKTKVGDDYLSIQISDEQYTPKPKQETTEELPF